MISGSADREKRRVAMMSALAAVGLTAGKAVVGWATGSLGLIAEAAHSGLDLVASMLTYFAVRVSGRPPDADHTYGHGRIESLSALVETLLLLLTCGWIVYEAVHRLASGGVEVDPSAAAFLTMLAAIAIDYTRSNALSRAAKRFRSQALEADALHFKTDIWSSTVVVFGLACVWAGQRWSLGWLEKADSIAALGVSAIVVAVSFSLGKRSLDSLLDRVSPELISTLHAALDGTSGILRATRIRVRDVGGRHFVDLEVEVDRSTALERAEAITTSVVDSVRSVLPEADVVVHPKPVTVTAEPAVLKVQASAARLGLKVHHVVVYEAAGRLNANYHLEVSDDALLADAWRAAGRLEEEVRKELPDVALINVHFDPRSMVPVDKEAIELDSTNLVQKVREILMSHAEVRDVHDLVIHQLRTTSRSSLDGGGIVTDLSCHCEISPATPIRRIHELDDELQREIRELIPSLRHLFVQPEPARERG